MAPPSPLSLQDAINWVNVEAQLPDTLVRLETASDLVQGLAELGDAALGYFVDQARHDGHSWSEIGDALGVSKQAAQQKHMVRVSLGPNAPTLENLTPRASSVLSAAGDLAQSWGHGYVGTEHLLLALYREPKGIGTQVLVGCGLSLKEAESAVAERVQRGKRRIEGDLTFTPRAIAVFSGALSSALGMNHNYIGTEHLLLGLVEGDGVAADVLRDRGLTQDMVARKVESHLARFVDQRTATKAPRKKSSVKASTSSKRPTATKARRK